jgi:hypothetical protein
VYNYYTVKEVDRFTGLPALLFYPRKIKICKPCKTVKLFFIILLSQNNKVLDLFKVGFHDIAIRFYRFDLRFLENIIP